MNNNKYSTGIVTTTIGANGFAIKSGWLKIFNVNGDTREYLGATMEFIPEGVSLPGSAYADEPTVPAEGMALRRTVDGKEWESVVDHRGKVAYSKHDRRPLVINFIGDLPEGLTLLQPSTDFDIWGGECWVTDTDLMEKYQIEMAQARKLNLQAEANAIMAPLQAAVKHGMASDEEKARLDAWEKYTVLLSRVDPSTVPFTSLPVAPE